MWYLISEYKLVSRWQDLIEIYGYVSDEDWIFMKSTDENVKFDLQNSVSLKSWHTLYIEGLIMSR